MGALLLVWLLSAVAVVALVYLTKSLLWRRFVGLGDIHWPGLLVISLIIGAVPAFFYHNLSPRVVSVPAGIAERPDISPSTKN